MRCLSLYDRTGTWPAFAPPGWEVYALDLAPKPLEWSKARGVQHIAADIFDWTPPWDRVDVILSAPVCAANGRLGAQARSMGTAVFTVAQGRDMLTQTLDLIRQLQPSIYCIENPAYSTLWTLYGGPIERKWVTKWGWYGYPAHKPMGFAGEFTPAALPFPLPEIDITGGGTRPCALRPHVGGEQAMCKGKRGRTPPDFARAWWAANA